MPDAARDDVLQQMALTIDRLTARVADLERNQAANQAVDSSSSPSFDLVVANSFRNDATASLFQLTSSGGNTYLDFVGTIHIRKLTGGTADAMTIDASKNTTVTALKVGANQVVGARATGWAAATGTKTRTSFATGTVLLPALAAAVGALIDDLIAHGLIGA